MLSLAQNSWLRYFTELPTSNGLPRDGEYDLNVTTGSNSTPEIHASSSLSSSSFDMALQQTIAEYGAARDHLEMVERKMRKMMEIKEARVKSEYELARRNLELVEKESVLVRQILSVPPGAEVIGLDDNQTEQRAKDDDEVTIRVERERGDNKMSMILEDREGEEDEQQHPFGRLNKILPNPIVDEPTSHEEELVRIKRRLADEEQARVQAEAALTSLESRSKTELTHIRTALKNEETARVKAEAEAADEARALYGAEQEVQRLRTELRLVGMDAKQNSVPFTMGQPDRRDQWLDTRNPDELIELQHAVGRALESANKRMNAENVKKRKLSKRVRSPSADAIALSHHHAKMGSLSSLALQAGVIQTPNGEQA